MMNRHPSRHIILVVAALIAANLALYSCATDSATKSYQTIGAINTAVQAGVKTFGAIYQSRKTEDPVAWGQKYDKVQAAYKKYQSVAILATDVAANYGETKSILAVVRESADDVLNLLAEFGVK